MSSELPGHEGCHGISQLFAGNQRRRSVSTTSTSATLSLKGQPHDDRGGP